MENVKHKLALDIENSNWSVVITNESRPNEIVGGSSIHLEYVINDGPASTAVHPSRKYDVYFYRKMTLDRSGSYDNHLSGHIDHMNIKKEYDNIECKSLLYLLEDKMKMSLKKYDIDGVLNDQSF